MVSSDGPRAEGFYWVRSGQRAPEVAHWAHLRGLGRSVWQFVGTDQDSSDEGVVVLSDRLPSPLPANGAEALVQALGGSVEAFEAACREASPTTLREALPLLSAPDPAATPEWAIERKWGKAYLERILQGRWG